MSKPENLNGRLDDEIQFHIEQQTAKNIRAGMSPEEARRAALIKFGGVERAREYTRDEFKWAIVDDFIRDVRVAVRTLARAPGFALAVIVTFALGLGAASSMFSVYDGVLLKPLPYPESDRIVRLFQLTEKGARNNISEPNFLDWKNGTHSFESMAEMARGEDAISGINEPMVTVVTTVSREFFPAMGVAPAAGRFFLDDELRVGAPPVAVVSSAFWQKTRNEGPRAPKNSDTFKLGDDTYTIVGVMPPGFDYPSGTNIWKARERNPPQTSRTAHNFQAVARLKDGVSLEQARADISSVSRALRSVYKEETTMADASAVPILEVSTGASKRALDMLFVASILLLVVASANVSNLMVARAAARRKEFAVQLSLGATSGRLTRQALAESLVLCVAGGLLGIGIATVVVQVFAAFGPTSAPRLDTVGVNWTGVALSLGVSALVAIVLSLFTAAGNRGVSIAPALLESTRGGTGSLRQMRVRQTLIVTELALTLVLLVGAGLLTKSFRAVMAVNPGYRVDNALIAEVTYPWIDGDRSPQIQFQDTLMQRARALPGVTNAAIINTFPLGGGFYTNGTFVEMTRPDEFASYDPIRNLQKEERQARSGQAEYRLVSAGYFETMGIPLIKGRFIDESDATNAPQSAVISQSLAKSKWPDQDPLGRYIQFGNMDGDFHGMRIVGVVGDVRELSPETVAQPMLYAVARQRPVKASTFFLVVRGPEPGSITESVRKIAQQIDPEVPVRMRTMEGALDLALGSRRFNLWLIGAFSVVAFALAALGVYGLIAFTVGQRTREIGIRMVLGAEKSGVIAWIMGGALKLAGIGVAVGLAISLGLMNLIDGLLYGVKATDPAVLIGVVTLTLLTALAASFIPARRVVGIPPSESLRDV